MAKKKMTILELAELLKINVGQIVLWQADGLIPMCSDEKFHVDSVLRAIRKIKSRIPGDAPLRRYARR